MTPVDLPSGLASDSVATTDARTEANRHDDRRCSDSPMGQGHSVCPPPAGTVFEGSGTRGHGRSGRRPRVIHPVMWDPDSNELAVEAARAHPDRFAIMGWVYLDQPDQRALLETWKSRPGMKGLRFYFSDPRSQSWPDDGTLDWLFPVAERLGIPVSLQASAFLPRVAEIAERHPGLKISID